MGIKLGFQHFLDFAGLIKSFLVLTLLTTGFWRGFLLLLCIEFAFEINNRCIDFWFWLESRGKDTIKFPICQLSRLIKVFSKVDVCTTEGLERLSKWRSQKWSKYGYRKKWPLFGTQICQNDMYFNSVSLSCRGAEVSTMELNLDASVQMRWWKKIHHMLRMQIPCGYTR